MQSQLAASCQNSSSNLANVSPEQNELPKFSGATIHQAPSYFRKKIIGPDSIFFRRKGENSNSQAWLVGGSFLGACLLGFGAFKTGQIQKALDCSLVKALKHFFQGKWDVGYRRHAGSAWEVENARRDADYWNTQYQNASNEARRFRIQIRDLENSQNSDEELEQLRRRLNQTAEAHRQSERSRQQALTERRDAESALETSRNELRQLRERITANTGSIVESSQITAARENFELQLSRRTQHREQLNNKYNIVTKLKNLTADVTDARSRLRHARNHANSLRLRFGDPANTQAQQSAEENERIAQEVVTGLEREINTLKTNHPNMDRDLENARSAFHTNQRLIVSAEEVAIRLRQEAMSRGEVVLLPIPLNLMTHDELKNLATVDPDNFKEKLSGFPELIDRIRLLLRADVPLRGVSFNSRGVVFTFDDENPVFRAGDASIQLYHEFNVSKVNRGVFNFNRNQREQDLEELLREFRNQKILPDQVQSGAFHVDSADDAFSWITTEE